METNKQNDEIEIDLRQIFVVLMSKIVMILLTGIILGLIALLGSKFLLKPIYQSSTKLYVLNRQTQGNTTFSDLQSSTQLTKDYKILITSRTVTQQVISELNLDMTDTQLAKSITVDTPTDTRILEITVQNHDQYKAKEIADKVAQIASNNICDIMQVEQVNIVEQANIPDSPVSPNVKRNAVIGGILGILLASGIVIVRFLLNDTIRSSEDIERYLGISTLALIPLSEELYDGESSKKKRKSKKKTSSNENTRKQGDK